MTDIAKTTKTGTVTAIIPALDPRDVDRAEIHVHDAEPLYEEIRVPNSLRDEDGNEVQLKKSADVEVHVEAQKDATTPKKA